MKKKIITMNGHNNFDSFAAFLADGGVFSPDAYASRENEDFSPEGEVNINYINSFARSNRVCYDKIA